MSHQLVAKCNELLDEVTRLVNASRAKQINTGILIHGCNINCHWADLFAYKLLPILVLQVFFGLTMSYHITGY